MPLRVLIGTANAGKTGVIHTSLKNHIAAGGHATLLLPSPADVGRAMAELSGRCPTGLEITTLGAHLDNCWRSVGDGRRLVSAVQRSVVLEESGKSVEPGCLVDSCRTPGFRRMLTGLVQRAAESDVMITEYGEDGDPGACLLRFLSAYQQALSRAGLIERGEAYRLVAARASALGPTGLIALNRFTGFTLAQERYIAAVSARCEVLVALTYSPDLPATEAAADLVSRLSHVGELEYIRSEGARSEAPELAAIELGFSAETDGRLESSGAVIVSEAWGRASEAARIVAEVQSAFTADIDPDGIAIVLRDPAAHMRVLRYALDEAGISADWDVRVPFEHTGFGRAVLGLLSICAGGADRVTWMDFMRSPYSPASPGEIDDLDARIRRSGIGGPEAARVLDSWLQGESAAFMRSARTAYRAISAEEGESRWHALSMAMIGRAYPRGHVLSAEGMLDAAASGVLVDAMRGVRGMSVTDAPARILHTALQGAAVSVGGAHAGGRVQVMSAERVRGRRYRCVIVGGLTAGEFPRVRRDEGFGALGAEAALARAGIDTASRDDTAAERLLFYQVVTRARDRLVLSRRSHDDGGQPLQPSIFLEEILDLYRCEGDASAPGCTVLGLDTGCSGEGAPLTPRREARSAARRLAGGATSADGDTHAVGRVSDRAQPELRGDARTALNKRTVFSVSDIETYLQCPYRWFVERVIRPSDLETRVDASTAGQTAHEVLARIYDRFIDVTGERRITPGTVDRALAVLHEVVEETIASLRTETAQQAAELRRAVRSTAGVLKADALLLPAFEPLYREWSFGMSEEDSPEPLDGYELRGRIDRIDCSGTHLLITDYKLGAVGAERGVARFEERGLVQLPLYAYVASRRLGLEISGAVYRSITRGDLRGFVGEGLRGKPFVSTDMVDAAGMQRVIDSARERAMQAVSGMRAGEIDAAPAGDRCSPYCAARLFCPEWGRHRG